MLLDRKYPQQEQKKFNILVLCTGNSARSIMAEALFNKEGSSYFRAFSAGSRPTGRVNPFALEQISKLGANNDFRSKSWDEFSGPSVPPLDFVITVCGNAAQEICPCFSGIPHRIHWGFSDPAAVIGSEDDIRAAFVHCFNGLKARIETLIAVIQNESSIDQIGRAMKSLENNMTRNGV